MRISVFIRKKIRVHPFRGSLSLEHALLIAALVAALIGMQAIVRRALCDRWRSAADSFAYGAQYAP